eukprot:m.354135 g.354135  ORF g.354135 m.354135 type:complete len:581 (-) comp16928_c0_seq1:238-1980(-)
MKNMMPLLGCVLLVLGLGCLDGANASVGTVCVTQDQTTSVHFTFEADQIPAQILATSPASGTHLEAGVDVLVEVKPATPNCNHGVAMVERLLCTDNDVTGMLAQSAYGHFGGHDSECVQISTTVTTCQQIVPRTEPCATNTIPVPTADQQLYQRHEIMGLTHFNMATFVANGDPACNQNNWNQGVNSSNPATFNPAQLNISNWIESYNALGAKHAVLTAKHGCGFLLWDTQVTLPDGSEYVFGVKRKTVPSFGQDVIEQFSTQLEAAGLGHGFYYSTGNNFYLNRINFNPAGSLLPGQANVTDDQYNALVMQHVTELWTKFGNLTEIWFDHGYSTSQKPQLIKLLQQYQPHANGFGGQGLTPNAVKWVGTESGLPNGPIWSTDCSQSQGGPTGTDYCPAGCDTTLQNFDTWFFVPNTGIRGISDMINVYHHTVGSNGVLELDFAIDRTGNVDPTHASRYAELGTWIKNCYGTPLANASTLAQTTVQLKFSSPTSVDRFMLQEMFEQGERVRSWSIAVQTSAGADYQPFANGTVIGYKQIVLGTTTDIVSAQLNILSSASQPLIRSFAAFAPCSTPSTSDD